MLRSRVLVLVLVLLLVGSARSAHAQGVPAGAMLPREVRLHYYAELEKRPGRALGYELLFPGAGHAYTGLWAQAFVTAGVSVLGAALWTSGAISDQRALWWAGAGTFALGRSYGLVSAPVGAVMLNAAFQRQLGLLR